MLKEYKPVTSSRRGLVLVDRKSIWRGSPEKTLSHGFAKTGGRSSGSGRITAHHRGGGGRRVYRIVDFKRQTKDVSATVQRIEYDPNRSAFIALIKYDDEKLAYILAPENLKIGDVVVSGDNVDIKIGNALPLRCIPIGTLVHNVEFKIGKGGQLARSAGSSVQIAGRDGDYIMIRMVSGELRRIHGACMATIGVLSNSDHKNVKLAKAGRSRWKGRRPHVRGVAKNPIDHPHGGGEGKTSGGRHPVTPWGVPTKGYKTRTNKRTSKFIVRRSNQSHRGR